jgi:hypothetical protein
MEKYKNKNPDLYNKAFEANLCKEREIINEEATIMEEDEEVKVPPKKK